MKLVYFLSLLVALIFADSTQASATRLAKKWNKPCCPISRCVFNKGDQLVNAPGFSGNTFNGLLQFTQSPNNTLQISGFINIQGAINEEVEGVYNIHVANCSTASTPTPGDPPTIDLDFESFGLPILTSADLGISNITNQCCFVVEEFAVFQGSIPPKERIYGVAPVETVVDCTNIH
ncbi:3129_t:CDS:1 [Paraglomus brasilianum]|uniref:3129_t:CDS:1 n=1 Tax=Paraglomus brasilianum TaxID=144538 RepID=A0A9N8Z1U3_9GLOM|nr:3129_t:CDS:1 [Paraglomus brasilianum]